MDFRESARNGLNSYFLGMKMSKRHDSKGIPTKLSAEEFNQFILPHLIVGKRGPAPKLSLYKSFSYILKILYMGCQWKELPIEKDASGAPEIHYTRIYCIFRRWESLGYINAIFTGSILK